jgi:multimeric flavodoxin WrbA
MRTMTILGSPRQHGNTAKALQWVEDQLRADGHEVVHINILDYDVGGCGECLGCKKGKAELCLIEDDANDLFRRMVAADIVLLAAPVFCWGFPAQIKALIDRMFCLMDFDGPRSDVPRLHGKPMSLLLTGGGEQVDNADLVLRGFTHLVNLLHARSAGNWYIPNCIEPSAMGEDVRQRSIEFAKTLIQKASS